MSFKLKVGRRMHLPAVLAVLILSVSACRTGFKDADLQQSLPEPPSGLPSESPPAPPPGQVVGVVAGIRSDPEVFTLTPSNGTLLVSATIKMTAANGTAPFVFAMASGGGSVDQQGVYTAPAAPGKAVVTVSDQLGRQALSFLTINPPLSLSQSQKYVQKATNYQVPVVGGVPPFVYSLSGGSVGQVAPDGSFMSMFSGSAAVRIADAVGETATMALNVYDPLQLVVDKNLTVVSSPVQLSATGGVPDPMTSYIYSISAGKGLIDNSNRFFSQEKGPFPVQAQVCVADTQGNQSCQFIQVVSTIVINAVYTEIAVGNSTEITVADQTGVGPFMYQEITNGGALGALAPCQAMSGRCISFKGNSQGTATIQVTDADNTTNMIKIKINPVLTVSPAAVTLPKSTGDLSIPYTFLVTGGVTPYTYGTTGGSILSGTLTTPVTNGPLTVTVRDAIGNTALSAVTITDGPVWAGIATVTYLSPTSVKVTWLSFPTAPAGFKIHWKQVNCKVTAFNSCAEQSAVDGNPNDTSFIVTGLTPNATYNFWVYIFCGNNQEGADANCGGGGGGARILSSDTGVLTVLAGGWFDIKVTGALSPALGSGLTADPNPKVSLTWNKMTVHDAAATTINGYNIYRGTMSGHEDFAIPINFMTGPILPSGDGRASYVDDGGASKPLAGAMPFYYLVKPIVNGLEQEVSGDVAPVEVKVSIPPANQVLVHRWSANQSLCKMLGFTSDPLNNYSCNFVWPNAFLTNKTVLDVGTGNQMGFLIDAFETGCNYSRNAIVAGLGCSFNGGAIQDCIGNSDPMTLAVTPSSSPAATVYYDRSSGTCFAYSSGNWVEAASVASGAVLGTMLKNDPGLPPLVQIPQSKAYTACQTRNQNLPTRLQQIAAAEWPTSVVNISQMETGGGTNCNTDKAHGKSFDSNSNTPADYETMPFTIPVGRPTPTGYSLRTGSNSTASCKSRYGAQDMVGNVAEWTADSIYCSAFPTTVGGVKYNCLGGATNLNGAQSEFGNIYVSNDNGAGNPVADTWNLSDSLVLIGPLMLPVRSHPPQTQDPNTFSLGTNQFRIFGAQGVNIGNRGAITGGAWFGMDPVTPGNTGAGRFSLDLSKLGTTQDPSIGFRCAVPVQ